MISTSDSLRKRGFAGCFRSFILDALRGKSSSSVSELSLLDACTPIDLFHLDPIGCAFCISSFSDLGFVTIDTLFVSSSFSIDSVHFLSELNFLHRNPFNISLFTVSKEHFVCLTGNFRLHVPRIGWILCHCDRCIWPLLFHFATYPNSNVPNPQLLVGERITARLLGKWTTWNVDAKENSDDSFIIHQSLRGNSILCCPH